MRKIALRGIVGRRRESLLLWTAVVLAFLFLALPTTLITSIEATDAAARQTTYGTWQVMASGLTEEAAADLSGCADTAVSLPMIEVSGADYFQGDNTYFLTACSPLLAELGAFSLREGRWPEAEDEMVVEYAKLVSMGLALGDSFSVQCTLELPMEASRAEKNLEPLRALRAESRARIEETCYPIFQAKDWAFLADPDALDSLLPGQEALRVGDLVYTASGSGVSWDQHCPQDGGAGFFAYWLLYYTHWYCTGIFADEEHPEGQAVPLEEMTEEQFAAALSAFIDRTADLYAPPEEPVRTGDLLGADGLTVRLDFFDGMGVTSPMQVVLIRRFTICGVIDTYTDRWDSGRADLPCGFITEESARQFLDGQQLALEKYPLFEPVPFAYMTMLRGGGDASALWQSVSDRCARLMPDWAESGEEPGELSAVRINRLAYPSGTESGGSLLLLVMGILFVTTVCAVFQICFTQIRRRLRRVVLLKSIGGTSGQIAGMMFWEFFYIWITAAPSGTVLGLLGAYAACAVLGGSQGRAVLLAVRPGVLAAALLAGTLALALGMALPAGMAAGVPLTGRTVRKKPLPPPRRETRQDFLRVTLRGLAAKKGHTAGTFALCVFVMTIALLCLFLGFRMLGTYRDAVVRSGRPEYLLRSLYAMNLRQREAYLAELEELGVCGEVTGYFTAANVRMDRSAWEGSPLFTAAAGGQPDCSLKLYAFPSTDPVFEQLRSAVTVGSLDPEAFDRGEQVLMFVPLYRDTGIVDEDALAAAEGWDRLAASGIDTSFYAEYDGVYRRDETFQVGSVLPLWTEFYVWTEEGTAADPRTAEVQVGAIVYYFPDQGIWPFSGGEGVQLAASPQLLSQLEPRGYISLNSEAARAVCLLQRAMPQLEGSYGYTEFYLSAREDAQDPDTALLVFARTHSMDIEVYRESSEKLLRDAVNNILLVCLLGLTAVLLALVIFANTVSSDIEQERRRIGILQALGVPDRLFVLRQLALGLTASAIALALANALLWTGAAAYARLTGAVLENLLWGYPAAWHARLSLAVAALLTLLFVLPAGRLRKYLPAENIRSRK